MNARLGLRWLEHIYIAQADDKQDAQLRVLGFDDFADERLAHATQSERRALVTAAVD